MISQQDLLALEALEDRKREAAAAAKRADDLHKAFHRELLDRIKMKESIESGKKQAGLEEYTQFMQPYKKICELFVPEDVLQRKVQELGYEKRERIVVTNTLPTG